MSDPVGNPPPDGEPSLPDSVGMRSGFVAVAGRPNAGKSTLVNTLVGEHVAIVSPIAQTTRRVVRAVLTRPDVQLVFVDLPGSQRPVDRLTERMQGSVHRSLGDVDVVLWVVDVSVELRAGERAVADLVFESGLPVVIAANKVDRLKPMRIADRLMQLAEIIGDRDYETLVPVSATTGDGVERIVEAIAALMPAGPSYYGPDDVTDMRTSERISEYVREATLRELRDELPHATMVEVVELDDAPERLSAECIVWVERESQVGIVVGSGGERIKQIGTDARRVLEEAFGVPVDLRLRVKVRKRWRDDDSWLQRSGL